MAEKTVSDGHILSYPNSFLMPSNNEIPVEVHLPRESRVPENRSLDTCDRLM